MQTWAILAAKHVVLTSGVGLGAVSAHGWSYLEEIAIGLLLAGMGLAAVASRPAPSCPIGPAGGQLAAAHSGPPARGRMSRFRRRVDGVLTGMLSDDEETLTARQRTRGGERQAEVEEKLFETPLTWDGDYVDALPWHRPKPPDPYPAVLPRSPDPNLAERASAGRSSGIAGLPESSVTPWPQTPAPQGAGAFSDAPWPQTQGLRGAGAFSDAPWPQPLGPQSAGVFRDSPWPRPPASDGAGAFADSPWLTVSAAFDGEQLWPLGNRRPGQVRDRSAVDLQAEAAGGLEQFPTLPPPQPLRRDEFQWFAAPAAGDSGPAPEIGPEFSDDERDARRWSAGPGSESGEVGRGAARDVGGYRSKHRMDRPAGDTRLADGRPTRARHAAPANGGSASGRKAGAPAPASRSASGGPAPGQASRSAPGGPHHGAREYPGVHK
jgi:hypothetical protein